MVERTQPMTETPLPWHSVKNSWQYTTIYDANSNHVCRFDLEDWPVTEENQDELEKRQAELVALIVEAVNSHEALKARIQEQDAMLAEAADWLNAARGWEPQETGAKITAYRLAQQKAQPKDSAK